MNKNNDYTESAVNLTQSGLVGQALYELSAAEAEYQHLVAQAEASELGKKLNERQADMVRAQEAVRVAIDAHGSWQDTDKGIYAVKQRKVTMVFSPSMVKSRLPDLAGDIITVTEAVDKKVIERLIKDGFTSEEAVSQCGRPRESFVYIIETGGQ